jgi:hypothetical protein
LLLFGTAALPSASSPSKASATEALTTDMDAKTDDLSTVSASVEHQSMIVWQNQNPYRSGQRQV